jgi:Ser/Thr protein kinase RdoA (MazF antagonist)
MPVKEKPVGHDLFQLDEACLETVRREYGLEEADSFLPILLDGTTCSLLEVRSETSRKAVIRCGEKRYFVKQIPWYADDPALVRTSHRLQDALARQGAPVAGLLATTTGRSWIQHVGSKLVVFDFRAGVRYSGSLRQLTSAAAVLPRIHQCQVSLPEAQREDWFALVQDHLELARKVVAPCAEFDAAMDFLQEQLDELRAAASSAGWHDLPDAPVHGDINPWNFLFDPNGKVSCVVDFDNCDVGRRVRDIGEGALTFCAMAYADDSTTFRQPLSTRVDSPGMRDFLTTYQREAQEPLVGAELVCLDVAFQLAYVELVTLGLIRGEFDAPRDLASIRAWLAPLPTEILRGWTG